MKNITNQTELNALIAKGPVVIDFYADWCPPCRILKPTLEKLSETYKKVQFVICNIDDAPDLANEYNVSAIPALKFFKDGKLHYSHVGLMTEQKLRETFDLMTE